MREAFQSCHRAVMDIKDENGRLRCELFKELPNRDDYPDYYLHILQPIAISTIRKRVSGVYYKNIPQFRADWHLMFNNARLYNQEGSIVYDDANAMQKVFDETLERLTAGTDLPGATNGTAPSAGVSTGGYVTPSVGYDAPLGLEADFGRVDDQAAMQSYATPPRRIVKRNIVDSDDDEDYQSSV